MQIATWNDWGEGTSIEPSHEFGYRDLEVVQAARRRLDSRFAAQPDDLRLPNELLKLRRKASDAGSTRTGDEIAARLAQGQFQAARKLLTRKVWIVGNLLADQVGRSTTETRRHEESRKSRGDSLVDNTRRCNHWALRLNCRGRKS